MRLVHGCFWTGSVDHDFLNSNNGLKGVMAERRIGQESFSFGNGQRARKRMLEPGAALDS
jgi:hypothetical protein